MSGTNEGTAGPGNTGKGVPRFLMLKTAPPRIQQGFLVRSHIALQRIRIAGIGNVELSAPHGFGKTSQLAQWHREALVSGIAPMWFSADQRDDPARFIQGLTVAASRAAGMTLVSEAFAQWIAASTDPQDAATAWLAEIGSVQEELMLFVDDADRLPEQSLAVLQYIIINAPSNLHIALSSRPNSALSSNAVLGSAPMLRITARELRLREEETVALCRQVLGQSGADDLAVRIHGLTEGWPLGSRLAIAAQVRNPNVDQLEHAVAADLGRYFLERVLNRLPSETFAMLVRIAHLDPVHPELCKAVLGEDASVGNIDRLVDEYPILTRNDDGPWLRLHATARELLGRYHDELDAGLRQGLAARACHWYTDHGMFEEAAHQARLAGDDDRAMRLAEAGLRAMTQDGRNSEVLDWYARVSPAEIGQHPGFWAPAAWTLAMSNRFAEADEFIERIRSREGVTPAEVYEAAMIEGAVAGYRDDLLSLGQFQRTWPAPFASAQPSEIVIHGVSLAHKALLEGKTDLSRQCLVTAQSESATISPVSLGFAELLGGLSYLWEGRVQLAREHLQAALRKAEMRMDRRNRVVCMIAAALAQACFECGLMDEARRHLALRLPIIEKQGIPDTVIAALVTLANIALEEGRQDQVGVLMGTLAELGRSRSIPRFEAVAGYVMTRLHARHGRFHSALEEAGQVVALAGGLDPVTPPAIRKWCELHASLAWTTAILLEPSGGRAQEAVKGATDAISLARQLNRGASLVEALLLRADAYRRLGDTAETADRDEALSLASASGLETGGAPAVAMVRAEAPPSSRNPTVSAQPRPQPDPRRRDMLTPREHDVLIGLAGRMSNKEIALSMGLGEETVKWHLKNLFQKLDAGDRKTAVRRAQVYGLL